MSENKTDSQQPAESKQNSEKQNSDAQGQQPQAAEGAIDQRADQNAEKSTDQNVDKTEPATKAKSEKVASKQLVKEKTAEMKKSQPASSKPDASKSSNNSNKSSHNNPAHNQRKFSVVNVLALPLAVLAVAASAYLWQQGQQQQSQAAANINALQQQLLQQQQSEQSLRNLVAEQNLAHSQQRQQLSEQVDKLQLSLKAQQKRLQSLATTDREDWLLAEAEYLMKLANQRLLMGKELQGAAELLAAADEILKDFDDAALHSVRKVLAQEIVALKSAARMDLEGVYLRLDAMVAQVEQMDLFKAPQLSVQQAESEPVAAEGWQQRLDNSYQSAKAKLAQYIQIKRRDESYKPLLAPEKEAAIRHNLRLMFEQAQLALLAGKQQLYDQSLSKSQRWVNDYFAIDEQRVERFNQLIDELKRQTVTVELPDISASSRALKTYIETIHDIPLKKPAEKTIGQPKIEPPSTEPASVNKTAAPTQQGDRA